jgi:ABC-2 type transport system permease protein
LILFYSASASFFMATLGIIIGLWADKYDHVASITNFIITPLSFLSGTFYSVERLPEPFLSLAVLNPFFYVIDGLRAGFIGRADASLWLGAGFVVVIDVFLWLWCLRLFRIGYKIKA